MEQNTETVTVKQAAKFLGLDDYTYVYKLIKRGRLQAVKYIYNNRVRVRMDSLEELKAIREIFV